MSDSIEDVFENFDIEEGTYNIGKLKLKLRDLTVPEYENLQDRQAEMEDLQGKEVTSKEALRLEREWTTYVLKTAFGEDVDINAIKAECTAARWTKTIAEVVIFLVKFSGMEGLRGYINTLKANLQSQKKIKG